LWWARRSRLGGVPAINNEPHKAARISQRPELVSLPGGPHWPGVAAHIVGDFTVSKANQYKIRERDKNMSFWSKLFSGSSSKMFKATREGNLEKVKALLKGNSNLVFKKDNAGWTPLHYAAHWDHKDVAELLLANKAEVNARATNGLKPLHCAVAQGYKDVAELLLASNADVNAQDEEGITPLHFAAEEGRKDVVELLLSRNADVNAKDNDGKTPLRLAVSEGHADVVELLRQRGGHE
jgi:hypothetical protein